MKWWVLSLVFLIFSCSGESVTLKIACAANLEPAIDSITRVFSSETGTTCEVVSAASGTLSTQIENGAAFHIFISADEFYPKRLHELGLADQPEFLARGGLTLVNLTQLDTGQSLETLLNSPEVKRIGMADPEIAPYGKATKDFLISLKQWDRIQEKLVFADNVGQLNSFIESGAVDIAFTSEAFAIQTNGKYNCKEIMAHPKPGVKQYFVKIYQNGTIEDAAYDFADFLHSPKSSKILQYFGYSVE